MCWPSAPSRCGPSLGRELWTNVGVFHVLNVGDWEPFTRPIGLSRAGTIWTLAMNVADWV